MSNVLYFAVVTFCAPIWEEASALHCTHDSGCAYVTRQLAAQTTVCTFPILAALYLQIQDLLHVYGICCSTVDHGVCGCHNMFLIGNKSYNNSNAVLWLAAGYVQRVFFAVID